MHFSITKRRSIGGFSMETQQERRLEMKQKRKKKTQETTGQDHHKITKRQP
jgi:hypothetical protein